MPKFNKLDVPYQWKDEFTKYPHGYTIFEALCKWTKQVDEMVDNVNDWNDYLDNFVKTFELELQKEVIETLSRWQREGKLNDIINEALQTEIDDVKRELSSIMPVKATSGDMTSALKNKLASQTSIDLFNGDFYLGELDMQTAQSIKGSGMNSRLRLQQGKKHVLSLSNFNTIEKLRLMGSASTNQPSSYDDVDGILIEGNGVYRNIINNVMVQGFSGSGIHARQTGTQTYSTLISNVMAYYNGVGFNIDDRAEYYQINNCNATDNFIGCINNGGNNIFNNCSFSSNGIDFLIDGKHWNHGHGSANNCFMKHGEIYGVYIVDCDLQYVFNSCQISSNAGGVTAYIKNSTGIIFNACRFGANSHFIIDGAGLIVFDGCIFNGTEQPTFVVTNGAKVEVNKCYLADGTPVEKPTTINNVTWLYHGGQYASNFGDMGDNFTIAEHVPLKSGIGYELVDIRDNDSTVGYKCGMASKTKIDVTNYSKLIVSISGHSNDSGGFITGLYSTNAKGESISTYRVHFTTATVAQPITLNLSQYSGEYYILVCNYSTLAGRGANTTKIHGVGLVP